MGTSSQAGMASGRHDFQSDLQESLLTETGSSHFIPGLGHLLGWGSVVPINGDTGWAKSARFHKTSGVGVDDMLYINIGDNASSTFVSATVS